MAQRDLNDNPQPQSFDDITGTSSDSSQGQPKPTVRLRFALYDIRCIIADFIKGPELSRRDKKKKRKNHFRFIAENLISTLPEINNELIVRTTKELLEQHRTIEDTSARQRLEAWACKTIIIYLVCVLLLVILNGVSRLIWPEIFKGQGFISDNVMYVILSTTTVNIIGLGVIVLKGHFPQGHDTKGDPKKKDGDTSL